MTLFVFIESYKLQNVLTGLFNLGVFLFGDDIEDKMNQFDVDVAIVLIFDE